MSELCALGASIGADVPFALMGGTCRVKGVGDLLKPLPTLPGLFLCRRDAQRRHLDAGGVPALRPHGQPAAPGLRPAGSRHPRRDLPGLCAAAGNALEHCSGATETPAIRALLDEHGALTSLMTGSGAAVFGVFDADTKRRRRPKRCAPGISRFIWRGPTAGGAPRKPIKNA